jgi:HK97 family phage prohead protease
MAVTDDLLLKKMEAVTMDETTILRRAYSIIEVKNVDEKQRTFTGIATTPALDRMNDSVNSLGAKFAKEIPLLHAHKSDQPIGTVRLGKPTKAGIPFEASIPIIHEPPTLKERVDVAFGEVRHGLVRAVSIGFRPLSNPTFNEKGGYDFDEVEIMELSTVAIPAHQEALIHTIKSIDRELRQAAGVPEPEIQTDASAATGRKVRVVRLNDPARDRAGKKPFVIRQIRR